VICFAVLALGGAAIANARDLFDFNATVLSTGENAARSFSDVESFVDQVGTDRLSDLLTTYTETSPTSIIASIRGLPATLSYAAE
jgi:hypothetical protein